MQVQARGGMGLSWISKGGFSHMMKHLHAWIQSKSFLTSSKSKLMSSLARIIRISISARLHESVRNRACRRATGGLLLSADAISLAIREGLSGAHGIGRGAVEPTLRLEYVGIVEVVLGASHSVERAAHLNLW